MKTRKPWIDRRKWQKQYASDGILVTKHVIVIDERAFTHKQAIEYFLKLSGALKLHKRLI